MLRNTAETNTLSVTSPAFKHFGTIPARYTCEGKNVNPPLDIGEIPGEASSLVLIIDDPDAPHKTWVHWVVWNIPLSISIGENKIPGIQGMNDFKRLEYGGPCPPSGTHRYFFKVYALNKFLSLHEGATMKEVETAMQGNILAWGELIGVFKRSG
jgi:Raf kinase inhibitor-like YbhB/YbcL family protein